VRRADAVEPFFTFDVDPPAFNTTTGKREGMCTFAVDNSEFHIAIMRRGIYQVPFHRGHFALEADQPLWSKSVGDEISADEIGHTLLALID
jgi:hypothetical protein